ncbi:MAG: L-seryl-tRNA(Sec) selenium transferase [Gemmatimonadota bacterium]
MSDPRRAIPAVDRLLDGPAFEPLLEDTPRDLVRSALRAIQDEVRAALGDGSLAAAPSDAWYVTRARELIELETRPSLRPVINATGVVLHTNLGRAPLSARAAAAAYAASLGYTNLEYDLERGARGSRHVHAVRLLRELTGAEDAVVVNNNAAALVLALRALAGGGEVIVSRGELIEIGGSFRIPEVMEAGGARLVEVGTTNRTHERDYRAAIGPDTRALVKVHRSNFRVSGFTAEVDVAALAALAREAGVPLIVDLGSGILSDPTPLGLPAEPTARQVVEAGADLVTMSGDKALGGPQAGIAVGRAALVEALRRDPLARAVRVGKLTLAALEATLAAHRDPRAARTLVPVLAMLSAPPEELARRAAALAAELTDAPADVEVVEGESAVGGGAFPEAALPTHLVAVAPSGGSAAALEARLRAHDPPVIAMVRDDRVVLDLRTVPDGATGTLVDALRWALASTET